MEFVVVYLLIITQNICALLCHRFVVARLLLILPVIFRIALLAQGKHSEATQPWGIGVNKSNKSGKNYDVNKTELVISNNA